MAYYDDRQHPPPNYEQDPYHYSRRGYGAGREQMDVVRRRDGNEGSAADYYRGYPQADTYDYGSGNVRRSQSMASYQKDPGYQSRRRRSKRQDDRYDDRRDYYTNSPPGSRSPSRRRRKSISQQALNALGLGSAATTGSRHRDSGRGRSPSRDHRSSSYSPSPSRGSRHHRAKSEQRISQAVRAALTAGAIEAFRVRKEPGDWTGNKGRRILTAALTAGGTDGLVDSNPNKHSKRHIIESTIAGLAANRMVNGPRPKSHSKSRGRSHSRGGIKDLATAGLLATAGKGIFDRVQSRSRSRHRHRSSSRDSYDRYDQPRRSKKRSKSVTDYITEGMGALGFGERDDRRHRNHRSSRHDDYSDDSRYSDYDSRHRSSPRRGGHSKDVSRPYRNYDNYPTTRGARGDESYGYGHLFNSSSSHDHDRHRRAPRQDYASDTGNSTDEEEKNKKKLTRDLIVTTGLATAATIHAAHSVHESMEKHHKRVEMLKEGEITPEKARRLRLKAQLHDTANVGMAALGIQGAITEWKHAEMKRRERATFQKERKVKRNQRAQSVNHKPPKTMYPDEIEENFSNSGSRSRSMGRSPSI